MHSLRRLYQQPLAPPLKEEPKQLTMTTVASTYSGSPDIPPTTSSGVSAAFSTARERSLADLSGRPSHSSAVPTPSTPPPESAADQQGSRPKKKRRKGKKTDGSIAGAVPSGMHVEGDARSDTAVPIKSEPAWEPVFVKPEPQSPVLGPLTLYDPMEAYEDELELGEISEVTPVQREILAKAAEQNLILVMEDDFDITPLYLMKSYKSDIRPTLFLIPPITNGRLDSWIDVIALRCTLSIGVIDNPVMFAKELQDIWGTLLTKNLIVASTEAFLQALQSDIVFIESFSLIIVDECHLVHTHAPYHAIFLSYFSNTPGPQRPAIFGLTTMPFNVPAKFNSDVILIEEALSAYVWGISDVVRDKLGLQMQLVMTYAPSKFEGVTPLFDIIRGLDEKGLVFWSSFESAKEQMKELGPYASDMVWRRHSASHELRRNALVKGNKGELSFSVVEETRTKLINLVREYDFPKCIYDVKRPDCNVAPKLATLITVLEGFLKQGQAKFRGIVVVHKRSVAKTLADVLRSLAEEGILAGLRPRALVGASANMFDPHGDHLTKAQALTRMKEGGINLLVTTGVGFDLEISFLSVLIRFDVFEGQTAIQIQQSRLRKAAKIHLLFVEDGKESDLHATAGLAQHEYKVKGKQASPQAPLRRPRDGGMDSDGEDEYLGPYFEIGSTGTNFYATEAVQTLIRYISIQEKKFTSLVSEYENVDGNHRLFTCTLRFPESAELRDMTGAICQSKAEARKDAAFKACERLNEVGRLEQVIASANKKLKALTRSTAPMVFDRDEGVKKEMEIRQNKTGVRLYPRKKPELWKICLAAPPPVNLLYPAVIVLDPGPTPLPGAYRSMCILSRVPIPTVPVFDLFFPEDATQEPGDPTDRTAKVKFVHCAPIEIPLELMEYVHRFTIRTVRCCASRPFICPPGDMAYFFLPLLSSWSPGVLNVQVGRVYNLKLDMIDWIEVKEAAAYAYRPVDMGNLDQYTHDSIVQDRELEFTRRHVVLRVRHDLTPLSKPADSSREQAYESILEYCRAKRKGFEGINDETQPLFEVERTPSNLNRLCPTVHPSVGRKKQIAKYLIPELCTRYTLSLSTYRTTVLLPSIISRLENLLLVRECNDKLFEGAIDDGHLLHALTTPSVLAEFNYERLELLGDSFLKYLASIYLFVTCPKDGEGALHVLRQRIISNRALLFHADRMGLPQYIQSKILSPRGWWPPNYRLFNSGMMPELDAAARKVFGSTAFGHSHVEAVAAPDHDDAAMEDEYAPIADAPTRASSADGNTEEPKDPWALVPAEKLAAREDGEQQLGDKAVADVAEATIGAAYLTAGKDLALTACRNLGLPLSRARSWEDLRERAAIFFGSRLIIPPAYRGKLEGLEELIGHKFRHPFLLVQAMTHASAQIATMPCYERLEFLGDAILDFMVVRHIFSRYGELMPGSLTLLKGAMVCNTALAAACVDAGLHKFIHYESVFLAESISRYVARITKAKEEELRKATEEGRPPGEYWVEHEPPKVLSDVVESLLGAACVSESFHDSVYEGIFDRLFKPFFSRHVSLNTLSQHPTKLLFERLQAHSCQKFEVTKAHVTVNDFNRCRCDIVCHDKIIGTATENNVVLASRHACVNALETMDKQPDLLDTICKCREDNLEKKAAKREARVQAQLLALAQAPIQNAVKDGPGKAGTVEPAQREASAKAGQKRKRGEKED